MEAAFEARVRAARIIAVNIIVTMEGEFAGRLIDRGAICGRAMSQPSPPESSPPPKEQKG